MNKLLKFGIAEPQVVMGETISGFSLNIGAVQTNDTLAVLADLNKIYLKIAIQRQEDQEREIYGGQLDDYLTAVFSQTPSYELIKKAFGLEYKVLIPLGGVIALSGGDKLTITVRAEAAAFTNLDANRNLTFIELESIPEIGHDTTIWKVDALGIGNGEININRPIGGDIEKVVLAGDYTTDYFSSVKAKPVRVELSAYGYERSVSAALLELENIHYFDDNPESDINQLVVYWAKTNMLLQNAKLNVQLDKAADEAARILIVRRASM